MKYYSLLIIACLCTQFTLGQNEGKPITIKAKKEGAQDGSLGGDVNNNNQAGAMGFFAWEKPTFHVLASVDSDLNRDVKNNYYSLGLFLFQDHYQFGIIGRVPTASSDYADDRFQLGFRTSFGLPSGISLGSGIIPQSIRSRAKLKIGVDYFVGLNEVELNEGGQKLSRSIFSPHVNLSYDIYERVNLSLLAKRNILINTGEKAYNGLELAIFYAFD